VRVEKLTQAILAKAFRGELVPTETDLAIKESREYESATALLNRVRQMRALPADLPRANRTGSFISTGALERRENAWLRALFARASEPTALARTLGLDELLDALVRDA
jgi:hypothetical protein